MRTLSLVSVVVMGLATASVALAAPLVVRGSDADKNVTCQAGQDVQVTGSGHRVTIGGDCGQLTVRGDHAQVTIDGVASVVVMGSDNDVAWSRNLSNADKLPVRSTGSGNHVHQAGGGGSDGAPSSSPSSDSSGGGGGGGSSSGPALVVDGTRAHKTLTCQAGQAVNITGSMHEITLQGDCGKVSVDGSSITVNADGVASIRVEGSMNHVTWKRNLSGQQPLPVSKSGSMNDVTGP